MQFPVDQYITEVVPQAVALLALIVLVVITGLLVALKQHAFDWKKLAEFMTTIVIPKFGGWLLLQTFVFVITPQTIPEGTGWSIKALQDLAIGAYGLIFISLLGQALGNLIALGVIPQNQYTNFLARKDDDQTDPHLLRVIRDLSNRSEPRVQRPPVE